MKRKVLSCYSLAVAGIGGREDLMLQIQPTAIFGPGENFFL